MRFLLLSGLLLMISHVGVHASTFNTDRLDDSIPVYKKASGVAGNLSSIGSDTLANLMTLWAEEFKRIYPNVNIQVQAAGSSSAPPALIEATASLGPMSRQMKSNELAAFEEKFGYKPLMIPVAVDALAIYVNKDNPIEGLNLEEIDAIFSSTRKCGRQQGIQKWGDVYSKAPWKNVNMQLFGRNSVSGTYGYFKKYALCGGDFKNNVNEQPGSASVVQSVATSTNAIGYSGMGYLTAGVRIVPLSENNGKTFVEATKENVVQGHYPLSRFLYVYVNKHPGKPMEPLTREFIKLILSRQGQKNVIKDGYIPLTGSMVNRLLNSLN